MLPTKTIANNTLYSVTLHGMADILFGYDEAEARVGMLRTTSQDQDFRIGNFNLGIIEYLLEIVTIQQTMRFGKTKVAH